MGDQISFAVPQSISDPSECFFYHTMDVPGFGLQKGAWDLRGKFHDYIGHVPLEGKRVLDVGCASGFLTFSSEQAGASEVVAFDMDGARRQDFLPFQEKLYYSDYERWIAEHDQFIAKWKRAFWLCHHAYQSNVRAFFGDVYALPAQLGQFDVSIVGAVLEHLADPIKAMTSVARVTRGTMVLNVTILETEEKMARFEGSAAMPHHDYVFWTYSLAVYREVLKMLGFRIARVVRGEFYFEDLKGFFPRDAIVAERLAP